MTALSLDVVVVDDNERVLSALERALRRRGYLPHAHARFSSARLEIGRMATRPVAALVDYYLDGGNLGVDLVLDLRSRFQALPIAILTGYALDFSTVARCAREHKAHAYEKLLLWPGLERFLTTAAVDHSLGATRDLRDVVCSLVDEYDLTAQETHILSCLISGVHRRDLAAALQLSENTLKSQMRQLLRKLGVADAGELTSRVLRAAVDTAKERAQMGPRAHDEGAGNPEHIATGDGW